MLTAMAGAVTNIILNFILIPKWGAMGAAVATLVCYLLVYVIRAVNTGKYVKFDLHTVKLIVNTALLSAQCYAWFSDFKCAWIAQIAIPVVIVAFNARAIVSSILKITGKFLKKI